MEQVKVPAKPVEKHIIKSDEAERAKQWLLTSIKNRYKENGVEDTTVEMFTEQYLNYKGDAIGREYDGLTEQQFADKWKDKYNTKLANRESFLINQQDWFNIAVTRCDLQNKTPDNGYMFNVIIKDLHDKGELPSEYQHKRDIKVISSGDSFLIDDILEYD